MAAHEICHVAGDLHLRLMGLGHRGGLASERYGCGLLEQDTVDMIE